MSKFLDENGLSYLVSKIKTGGIVSKLANTTSANTIDFEPTNGTTDEYTTVIPGSIFVHNTGTSNDDCDITIDTDVTIEFARSGKHQLSKKIDDAPITDKLYGRANGQWFDITDNILASSEKQKFNSLTVKDITPIYSGGTAIATVYKTNGSSTSIYAPTVGNSIGDMANLSLQMNNASTDDIDGFPLVLQYSNGNETTQYGGITIPGPTKISTDSIDSMIDGTWIEEIEVTGETLFNPIDY